MPLKKRKLGGLIFDLDGTLVDSAPDIRQAINHALTDHDRRPLTLDEVKHMVGDGTLVTLGRALQATAKQDATRIEPHALLNPFLGYYRGLPPDPAQLYPHAIAVIEAYRAQGIKIGLCTNKHASATHALLKGLNIHGLFDSIAGADTFAVHKPHPDHVRGVAEGMDVDIAACVMVGDSINDILSAHRAGIPCIAVRHGYGNDVDDLGADIVIDGLDGLADALNQLGYQAA